MPRDLTSTCIFSNLTKSPNLLFSELRKKADLCYHHPDQFQPCHLTTPTTTLTYPLITLMLRQQQQRRLQLSSTITTTIIISVTRWTSSLITTPFQPRHLLLHLPVEWRSLFWWEMGNPASPPHPPPPDHHLPQILQQLRRSVRVSWVVAARAPARTIPSSSLRRRLLLLQPQWQTRTASSVSPTLGSDLRAAPAVAPAREDPPRPGWGRQDGGSRKPNTSPQIINVSLGSEDVIRIRTIYFSHTGSQNSQTVWSLVVDTYQTRAKFLFWFNYTVLL